MNGNSGSAAIFSLCTRQWCFASFARAVAAIAGFVALQARRRGGLRYREGKLHPIARENERLKQKSIVRMLSAMARRALE